MIKKAAERNPYFELLRGVAIIMVVGIHTFKLGSDFSLFVRQVLNCAVPLFLACSGFFMAKKDVSDRGKHKAFLKKQLPKVYIPCLVWSIPYLIISLCNGGSVTKGILNLFLCGFSIYYFILLIIQYYLLLPCYQKMNKRYFILNIAVSLISIAVLSYLLYFEEMKIQLVLYAGWFPLWTMYFAAGVFLANRIKRDYNRLPYLIVAILALVLSFFESKYWLGISGGGIGIKISSFVYSLAVVMLLFSEKTERIFQKPTRFTSPLISVGRISFGIYLIHCYIILLFRTYTVDFWNQTPWILKTLIVLLLPIVVIKICRFFFKTHSARIGF